MVKSQHYYSRYQRFMDGLKGQSIDGYCEVHHIVPRSLGGSNDKANLISLTARQHYIAHWILARALGGSAARAFFMMSNFGKYGHVNSTTYAIARKEYSSLVSEQMVGRIMPPVSNETKEKQRQAKLGIKISAEHIEKIRQAQIGRKLSNEWKANVSKGKIGKSNGRLGCAVSEETKKRIGDAQRGKLNHMSGQKHSPETREKMRITHMKRKQNQAYLKWVSEGNTPTPADEVQS
jgi:hypothetical protein